MNAVALIHIGPACASHKRVAIRSRIAAARPRSGRDVMPVQDVGELGASSDIAAIEAMPTPYMAISPHYLAAPAGRTRHRTWASCRARSRTAPPHIVAAERGQVEWREAAVRIEPPDQSRRSPKSSSTSHTPPNLPHFAQDFGAHGRLAVRRLAVGAQPLGREALGRFGLDDRDEH